MATTPGRIRPWRYLAAFVGIVVVLYALVFFTGDGKPAPKLGIDLQGGTRVTLVARTVDGGAPPRDQLMQAQQIIEQRVNGLGVSGAEVVLDGDNITITVPGDAGEQARSLGQTAQLRFRPVIGQPVPAAPAPGPARGRHPRTRRHTRTRRHAAQRRDAVPDAAGRRRPGPAAGEAGRVLRAAAGPEPHPGPAAQPAPQPAPTQAPAAGAPTPADPQLAKEIAAAKAVQQSTDPTTQQVALQTLDCSKPDPLTGYDDPALPLVTCNQDGTAKYALGPSFLEGTQIASAQAAANGQGVGYVVNVTFKSAGEAIWGKYTTEHIGEAVAFTLDGKVVSAPTIQGAIFGSTEISGQFSQAQAQNLAGILRYGSLPLSFESNEAQTVSATLGLASLEAGLIAGGIGLLLVFVYCLIYYRVLGVLTILSLVLSGVIVFAVLVLLGRWIGFTLDLAGVAGLHRRDRHHRRLVRDLLRTAQGRDARGPHVPLCGAAGLGAGPAHDPVRRRGELPRLGRAVHPGRRTGEGLRVHAGPVHRARPGRGVPRDPSAGRARVELAGVRQSGAVGPRRRGQDRRGTQDRRHVDEG